MRKSHSFFLTLALALLSGSALQSADRVDRLRAKLFARDIPDVLVVAHRGDWRHAPENSLQAVAHSIKIGVDIVEVDLQRTADGALILMHDATLDRATTGKGKVADTTLADIRKLFLKNGCGIRTSQKIPTLEELLLAAKGRVLINLDKADRYFAEVCALLKKTGTARQIIMKGSRPDAEVRQLYGAYLDEVIYMPVVNLDKPDARKIIGDFRAGSNPVAYELLFKSDSNPLPGQLARELKGAALIWYNTLWEGMAGGHEDDRALEDLDGAYGHLVDTLGARIIQTDRAGLLLDYLEKRGLREAAPASVPTGPFAAAALPYVNDGTMAGAVFLAAGREKILACEAVGQAGIVERKPMREDSVFWIASMTKPMTAAAFMMLVDEGRVSLDEPVSNYIPAFDAPQKIVPKDAEKFGDTANFTGAPAAKTGGEAPSAPVSLRRRAITLRQLLSHTAGLRYSAPEEKPSLDLLPLAQAVGYYAAGELLFEPGTDYSYANTDINTIGRVIEIVSGMPYETFLQKRLLDPLGMTDTTFWPDSQQLARLATSYKGNPKERTLTAQPIALLHQPLDDRGRRHPFPAGGLFSTAHDVARFGQLLLNKGVVAGKRLLSEAAVNEMIRRQTPPGAKTAYGLGLNLQAGGKFGHGGAYATQFTVWPDDSLVTVFMVQKISEWGGPDGAGIRPAFEKQARELARRHSAK